MQRIMLDVELLQKLSNLTQPAELCDTTGKVVGKYIPAVDLSRAQPYVPEFSEEELRQQEESNEKTYTTAEVLAYLEKL